VTFWQAMPGSEQALDGYVMKSVKPVLDAAVASGTLLMYNFDKEDVHSDAAGGYNLGPLFLHWRGAGQVLQRSRGSREVRPHHRCGD